MLAGAVVDRSADLLNDADHVRWTVPEILRWITDGRRELVAMRPGAMLQRATMTLVAGSRQSLPAGAMTLQDIPRNANGRSVRLTERERLDEINPRWHAGRRSNEIRHFALDDRDPKTFWVEPPSDGTAQIEIVTSVEPGDVTTEGTDLGLDSIYLSPMANYVVFRALSKDSDFGPGLAVAQTYYAMFVQQVNGKIEIDANWSPNARKQVKNG
jgi:hypothetical protein